MMLQQKKFIIPLLIIAILLISLGFYYAFTLPINPFTTSVSNQAQESQTTQNNVSLNTQNQNTQNQTNQTTKPKIFSLSPSSGVVGTVVTVTGEGFTSTNNTVNFGGMLFTGISSENGVTLKFTVSNCPTSAPLCPAHLLIGQHDVSVSNSNGISNKLPFIVNKIS